MLYSDVERVILHKKMFGERTNEKGDNIGTQDANNNIAEDLYSVSTVEELPL